jgi:DNA primase
VPSISDARFDEIASALLERCALHRQADVVSFVTSRGIFADAQAVGFGALPPPREQAALVAELRAAFGGEDLALSGLVRGERLAFDEHRLVIPWRDRAGRVVTLQRRVIQGAPPSKYIFPKGRPPRVPFGVELARDALAFHATHGARAELIVCEGALDTLARRRIARLRGESCVVVGVASASLRFDGWADLVADRDVVVSFDADAAGDKAALDFAALCSGAKSLTRERPVDAGDVNEVLLVLGAAS